MKSAPSCSLLYKYGIEYPNLWGIILNIWWEFLKSRYPFQFHLYIYTI